MSGFRSAMVSLYWSASTVLFLHAHEFARRQYKMQLDFASSVVKACIHAETEGCVLREAFQWRP
eukprot:768119-Pelagomonas_calceolata.AAC.1